MERIGSVLGKNLTAAVCLMLIFFGYQMQLLAVGSNVQKQEVAVTDIDECGRWMAGDFHNHSYLTDGSDVPEQVFAHAFQFGLDWIANSEHGGAFSRNPEGHSWPADTRFPGSPPAGQMWRWQSLWQYSYPLITKERATWPDKLIFQGYEWNVPGHDHASVAIIGPAEERGLAIARHEYLFDDKDTGTTADNFLGTNGKIIENNHAKAMAGVNWLDQHYPQNSYFLINHPSRWQNYSIDAIRDFHNAAPDVAFGFEGMPGHQKASQRGHYDGGPFQDSTGQDVTFKARTYGGADYMLARVGGIWDALLGEGRCFYVFVNSDFHTTEHDFWPGEYAKNHTYAQDLNHDGDYSAEELVAGLRSGNSFIVQGDLIDGLEFSIRCRQQKTEMGMDTNGLMVEESEKVVGVWMGGTLEAGQACDPEVLIRFRTPEKNNNGDAVAVDHIDLIAGAVRGKTPKFLDDGVTPNPAYEEEKNPDSRVLASFTRKDWHEEATGRTGREATDKKGWRSFSYQLPHLDSDMYFRLRGTNLGRNVKNETDEQGNPLNDELLAPNNQDKAYADLWFYSNPIFVRVTHAAENSAESL